MNTSVGPDNGKELTDMHINGACSMLTQYIKGTASAITIDTVWMNIIDSCPVPVYTNESH